MNLNKTMQNLGLNGTIVIALLLMVIVYYLHLIEKNTSLERFNIGAQDFDYEDTSFEETVNYFDDNKKKDLLDDKEHMKIVLQEYGMMLEYVSPRLKEDPEVVKWAMEENAGAGQFVNWNSSTMRNNKLKNVYDNWTEMQKPDLSHGTKGGYEYNRRGDGPYRTL